LGKGATGDVSVSVLTPEMKEHLGIQKEDNVVCAFKRISDEESRKNAATRRKRHQDFQREARVLAHEPIRDHPNIVTLYAIFFEQDEDKYDMSCPVMVQEYADGGTLEDLISFNPESNFAELRPILCEVSNALRHLHGCCVAHSDIKPANVLIFRGSKGEKLTAKVTDFGYATFGQQPGDLVKFPLGSLPWTAPEYLERVES